MARAALGWSVRDLAAKSGVHRNTITRLESGTEGERRTVDTIRAALESAGVEFIAANGGGPGVRFKNA